MVHQDKLIDYYIYRHKNYRRTPYFHRHTELEIFYFHHGEGKYFIESTCIDLAPGDLIIINGVCRHGSLMKDACTRTMLRFEGGNVLPLLQQPFSIDLLEPFRETRHLHWRLAESEQEEIEAIFEKIDRFHLASGSINFNRLRTSFIELLLFICDIKEKKPVENSMFSEDKISRVVQVIDYVDRNYMKELTLDVLSDDLFFNKYYLSRVFKEITGMTIFEYVNKVRINQAKMMFMINKSQRVTDVCYQVGFNQLTHFSRNFKQIVGMSPEKYRKSIN